MKTLSWSLLLSCVLFQVRCTNPTKEATGAKDADGTSDGSSGSVSALPQSGHILPALLNSREVERLWELALEPVTISSQGEVIPWASQEAPLACANLITVPLVDAFGNTKLVLVRLLPEAAQDYRDHATHYCKENSLSLGRYDVGAPGKVGGGPSGNLPDPGTLRTGSPFTSQAGGGRVPGADAGTLRTGSPFTSQAGGGRGTLPDPATLRTDAPFPTRSPAAGSRAALPTGERLIIEVRDSKVALNGNAKQVLDALENSDPLARISGAAYAQEVAAVRRLRAENETFLTMPTSKDTLLGQGSYGAVHRVDIDGEPYAVKFEPVWNEKSIPGLLTERINHLSASAIASTNPKVPLVSHKLSFYDEVNRRFVTVMPLKPGGTLRNPIGAEPNAPLLPSTRSFDDVVQEQGRFDQLRVVREQIDTLRNGKPVKINGVEYRMEFYHLDIKADNVILDAQGHPSLTDFGVGQVVYKRALENGTFEYKMPSVRRDGEVELVDLRLDNHIQGSPVYFSREFGSTGPGTPQDAYNFIRDTNAHAYNAMVYEMLHNRFFLQDHFRMTPEELRGLNRESLLIKLNSANLDPGSPNWRNTSGDRRLLHPDASISLDDVRQASRNEGGGSTSDRFMNLQLRRDQQASPVAA